MTSKFPTRKRIRLPDGCYRGGEAVFVTMVCADRYPWFSRFPQLTETATRSLCALASERDAQLFAWCAMPEHWHLLIQDVHVPDFVRLFKGRVIPAARERMRRRKVWQRSFHDHVLRNAESVPSVARYIWENPVRRGLVVSPNEYPWNGSLVWPQWRELYR